MVSALQQNHEGRQVLVLPFIKNWGNWPQRQVTNSKNTGKKGSGLELTLVHKPFPIQLIDSFLFRVRQLHSKLVLIVNDDSLEGGN